MKALLVGVVATLACLTPERGSAQGDTTGRGRGRGGVPIEYHVGETCVRRAGGAARGDTACVRLATPPLVVGDVPIEYPAHLLQEGVEGEVLVEMIVDTAGWAEPASVRIVRTPHPGFEPSVKKWAERARFRPATLEGNPVRSVVTVPIRFAERRAGPNEIPSDLLMQQARAQMGAGHLDSAAALLRRVTDAPARAPALRAQAWVLTAIVKFFSEGDSASLDAFRQALALNPRLNVGGLDPIDPQLGRLFAAARSQVVPAPGDSAPQGAAAAVSPPAPAGPSQALYDCVAKCPAGVMRPRFISLPQMTFLSGAVLPESRSHAYVVFVAVVNESGIVEGESLRLTSNTTVGMEGQLRQALEQARFRPGVVDGVPVRTRVQVRFDFQAEGTGMVSYTYSVVGR